MKKVYHTRESILCRLEQGPAQFSEWAVSKNHKHGSRVQARQIIQQLTSEGLVRFVYIGRFPYYILNTPKAVKQAELQQIEECTKQSPCGCIHWVGYVDNIRGPICRPVDGDMPISVRRTLWKIEKGELGRNEILKMTCEDDRCVNLAHMKKIRRNTHQKGKPKPPATRARIAEAIRKRGKLSLEDAQAIRISTEANPVLAERFGVTASNISAVRRGKILVPYRATFVTGLVP